MISMKVITMNAQIDGRKAGREFRAIALFLSTILTAAGCAQYSSSNMPVPPTPPTPSASISFCNSATCTPSTSFALSTLRDLTLNIAWENLPAGQHSQTVSFTLPSGDLYRSYETSFEVPDGNTVPVATSQSLPVAGTPIVQRSMGGAWQVTVALDGKQVSAQTVTLNP